MVFVCVVLLYVVMARGPSFFVSEGEVRASGILFYCLKGGRCYYLFRRQDGRWCDIGGKTESEDVNPLDTAVRECCEETNGHMFSEDHTFEDCRAECMRLISENPPIVMYSKRSKYLLHMVKVKAHYMRNMKRFGRLEKHTSQKHYYKWMSMPYKLHPRLAPLKTSIKNQV